MLLALLRLLPLGLVLPVLVFVASVSPGQVASNTSLWANWVGLHAPWLTAKATDNWVVAAALLFAMFYSVVVYRPQPVRVPINPEASIAPRATPEAKPPVTAEPVRDVWLRDAIWYAQSGEWEPQPSDATTADDVYERLCDLCGEFRQRAFDGKLPIWSMDPDGLWRLVPTSHWADFQINYLFLINEKPEALHTEPVRLNVVVAGRNHLMTSKAAVTAFWTPPLRIPLRDATEIADARLKDRADLKVLVKLSGNDRTKIPGVVATMLFTEPGFSFPLYGTRPPYHACERVPDNDIRQQTFSDDASTLVDSMRLGFDGKEDPHWSGLEIRRADLDRRLIELEGVK